MDPSLRGQLWEPACILLLLLGRAVIRTQLPEMFDQEIKESRENNDRKYTGTAIARMILQPPHGTGTTIGLFASVELNLSQICSADMMQSDSVSINQRIQASCI